MRGCERGRIRGLEVWRGLGEGMDGISSCLGKISIVWGAHNSSEEIQILDEAVYSKVTG